MPPSTNNGTMEPAVARARAIDAYRLDSYIPERLVEEMYDGRRLSRLLARKAVRRLTGRFRRSDPAEAVVTSYAGLAVFDRPDLHKGGMAFGRDFPRALNELGVGRCGRLFEYCAGPGYIGYSLLAAGWCESLALADVNPESVAAARRTREYNAIEDRVAVYESDALDQIPASERWDLVIANPPHFLAEPREHADIQVYDTGWDVHERFYSTVGAHMNPGGLVVMVENAAGSDPNLFRKMIEAGGGRQRTLHPGSDIHGHPNGLYYQVSEW